MILPVSCTNVASVIGGDATAVDDDSQDHEAYAGGDLHYAEDEFDLFQFISSFSRRLQTLGELASP